MSELSVLERLREHLHRCEVPFSELQHQPTRTSEEAAEARGEELKIGGKALVLKLDGQFALFVLPADQRLDSKAIKRQLSAKKSRFASQEELWELTGLVPGSVPPFGRPVLPLPLFVDHRLTENSRVAFNAGSLSVSFMMQMADYLNAAQPTVLQV
ncbi:MAG: YbaK/EbsC family protein [Pirellulaceae bacterium]|nr:YbaK/EbsC family protein [Pirellulaceae bacterium]